MDKMLLKTLKSEHANLQEQINKLNEQMRGKSKELMKAAFSDFFEKHSEAVANIFWTQYTPYFNDGDSCEFSVNTAFITLKSDLEDEDTESDGEGSQLYDMQDIKNLKKKIEEIDEWKADSIGAAIKYQQDYIKRYKRDPFAVDSYSYYDRNKTTEQKMAEWKPFYGSEEDNRKQLEDAIFFVENYPELKTDFEEIAKMVSGIDENLMEAMFGDHAKVIVSADGIEIEEYQHD